MTALPTTPSRLRRWLRRAVVAVGLGVITTVGVAWACAVIPPPGGGRTCGSDVGSRALAPTEGHGVLQTNHTYWGGWTYYSGGVIHSNLLVPRPDGAAPDSVLPVSLRRELLPWCYGDAPWPPEGTHDIRAFVSCGWLLRALACAGARTTTYLPAPMPRTPTVLYGLPVPRRFARYFANSTVAGSALLPTQPLYRGLILDTLLFSAAWFPLLAVPGVRRRTRRRRRGHCPACGYDRLGEFGTPCPECGARVP